MVKKNISPLTQKLFSAVIISAVVVGLGACASKKKVEDQSDLAPKTESVPDNKIEQTPIAFDAVGSDSGKIPGLETVHFDYDRSVLPKDAQRIIQGNVKWLKSQPEKMNMTVEGHCDAHGSNEYNLALGERRAKAVKDYMVKLGIPVGRINTVSYGEEKLLSQGDSEGDNRNNRRANFVPVQ